MGALFRDTYRYRELIWALALKELRVRYKRSVLGFLWALLNPALLMLVLTLVFGTIMRFSAPHYSIFLLSGHSSRRAWRIRLNRSLGMENY